jgi:hypothetical protein
MVEELKEKYNQNVDHRLLLDYSVLTLTDSVGIDALLSGIGVDPATNNSFVNLEETLREHAKGVMFIGANDLTIYNYKDRTVDTGTGEVVVRFTVSESQPFQESKTGDIELYVNPGGKTIGDNNVSDIQGVSDYNAGIDIGQDANYSQTDIIKTKLTIWPNLRNLGIAAGHLSSNTVEFYVTVAEIEDAFAEL